MNAVEEFGLLLPLGSQILQQRLGTALGQQIEY
jgi:hypothetical protein